MIPKFIVFTLVHGTFARDATWTKKGSSLRATLREAMKPARVEFRAPEWSGKNQHLMRKRAALTLREGFKRVRAEHPDAKHYVIAHSHGGNVVRLALMDQAADLVDGVVTLNTPFLETVRRDKHAVLQFVKTISLSCVLAIIVNAVWGGSSLPYTIATALLAVASLTLLGAFYAHLTLVNRTANRIRLRDSPKKMEDRNAFAPEAFLEEWRPAVKQIRFLCLACAGDEAISGLSFLEGLANIPHILLHRTLVTNALAFLLMIGVVALAASLSIGWPPARWLSIAIAYLPWGLFLMLTVTVAAALSMRFHSLGISVGFKALAEDLLVHRWIVSYVPLSVAQVEFQDYEVQRHELDKDNFFLHSSIYDSEFALSAIQLWIRSFPEWDDSWRRKSVVIIITPKQGT